LKKKISHSDMVGKAGVALVTLRLSEMGFLFHETGSVEAGTDGFVELRDPSSGEMLSTVFRVQSKATENGRAWASETETSFAFTCKERDISDWVGSNVPVVLVCCDTKRQLAYWKDATSYFADPTRRQRRQVIFDKATDVFEQRAAASLAAVAIPKSAGIFIPPPAKKERLVSNLLEVVDYPKHVWVAPALVTHMRDVEAALRPADIGVECFVRGGGLYSFRPLNGSAWAEVCDLDAAERFSSGEWADSDDLVKQHEFAEFLRRALGEKVRDEVEYERKSKLFYFRASNDLSDVRLPGGRRAFGVYRKRHGDGIRFYRHLGFRVQFLRLCGSWYLEINPQYRFTADGYRPAKFQAENISKLKRMQHNDAVRQEVQVLAKFLNQPGTLLTPEYRLITFGDLLCFEVDFGFNEGAWRAREQTPAENVSLFEAA
jgi:Domain of unknown function (DUF4365)